MTKSTMYERTEFTDSELEVARKFYDKISIKIDKKAITLKPLKPLCTITLTAAYMDNFRVIKYEMVTDTDMPEGSLNGTYAGIPLENILSRLIDMFGDNDPPMVFTYPAPICR